MSLLVVGLGNPGKEYQGTRHNIGFEVADAFAEKRAITFRDKKKFKGFVADGDSIFVLKPSTFMNLSGEAVLAALQYLKISPSNTLIVVDDVDLPFGQIRLKVNSGPGTHNGLKSIENSLKTNRYARLKVGIGSVNDESLQDYVLGRFSKLEEEEIPQIINKAVETIERWQDGGLTRAMEYANHKIPSNPSKENNE